ncbi:MAG: SoxR reducing system RseC family protein [bacterium]|nr:MAG: SoxR reducing system RseC family protein [bacterium]
MMLEETAKVVSVSHNSATVSLVQSAACGSCSAKSMCHPASDGTMLMEVGNTLGARPGETVVISLPPTALLKASTLAYMFPALLTVMGGAVGWSKTGRDSGAIVGAAAGFALASLFLYLHGRRKKGIETPSISRILETGGHEKNDPDHGSQKR